MKNFFWTISILILITLKLTSCSKNDKPISSNNETISTSFIAYGDMPYYVKNYPIYEALIKNINLIEPSLVIHTGDASHPSDCTNETIDLMHDYMNSFDAPLLFALGDNDWTDCPKSDFNSIERLNYYRQTHFSSNSTLGAQPLKVSNQNELGYPENMRFKKDNIGFITVHVVGSQNNMIKSDLEKMREFSSRNKVNLTWLEESFNVLSDTDAIVVTLHANMIKKKRNPLRKLASTIKKDLKLALSYKTYKTLYEDITIKVPYYTFKLPYRDIGGSIQKHSFNYKKPVLILHGDTHRHNILKPTENFPYLHVIETFGTPRIKAIEIAIRPKSKNPFKVEQIIEP